MRGSSSLGRGGGNVRGRGRGQQGGRIRMMDEQVTAPTEPSTEEDCVDDPYDPTEPNDYIQIQREKNAKRAQERREKERQQYLERLEEERTKMALERQKLAEKQLAGEAIDIPTGRGRGISNMPAWLTTKKSDSSSPQKNHLTPKETAQTEQQQNDIKPPSNILLIKNLAPGPQLLTETRSECETKYGNLEDCVIDHEASASDAVVIALKFKNKNHAVKAFLDLRGRFFAGRQISAEFSQQFPCQATSV
uniref:RRM domain-containing protein n=1 Tax=Aureoumbra lagunensis TaxID=44058 RepID=A0A7S3K2M8_9STRA|mmetsp:Transcript_5554/g.8155  ORF Transcript_5554/g.8155 Transcript_5554/m.8155 type:complete len:249 (+) Transcript_5554:44-790(+)